MVVEILLIKILWFGVKYLKGKWRMGRGGGVYEFFLGLLGERRREGIGGR